MVGAFTWVFQNASAAYYIFIGFIFYKEGTDG